MHELDPTDVVAEFLALAIVEHTNSPDVEVSLEINGFSATITDTGRGMKLSPDDGDTVSHAQRALTSTYPIYPTNEAVRDVLVDVVWGDSGSLGPSLANAHCPVFEFSSRRDGEEWSQLYHNGVPDGPAVHVGPADDTGTTVTLVTAGPIDEGVIAAKVGELQTRIPNLHINYEPSTIHRVVAAVLHRDGQILLCHRRAEQQWYGDVWDLPGGHVAEGEDVSSAIVRELNEELGIEVSAPTGKPLFAEAMAPDAHVTVWAIDKWRGDVTNTAPEEHDQIGWFSPTELDGLKIADPTIIELCLKVLGTER